MMWPPIIELARRKVVMLVALALLTGAILVLAARPRSSTLLVSNSSMPPSL